MDILTMYAIKHHNSQAPLIVEMGDNPQGAVRGLEPLPTYRLFQIGQFGYSTPLEFKITEDLQILTAIVAINGDSDIKTQVWENGVLLFELVSEEESPPAVIHYQNLFLSPGQTLKLFSEQNGGEWAKIWAAPIILSPPLMGTKGQQITPDS